MEIFSSFSMIFLIYIEIYFRKIYICPAIESIELYGEGKINDNFELSKLILLTFILTFKITLTVKKSYCFADKWYLHSLY